MLLRVAILLGVVGFSLETTIPGVKTTENFTQAGILDSDGSFIMFWNRNDTHVTFEVHVNTKGWVGLGLSGNGNMFPGDVVIGWVSADGTAHLSDRHTLGHYAPLVDNSQDWHLLHGEENEFGTTISGPTHARPLRSAHRQFPGLASFARGGERVRHAAQVRAPHYTCDGNEDEVIPQGTTRMIYAYGSADPAPDGTISYHDQSRCTKSVALLSANHVPTKLPTDLKRYDFLNQNFIIPANPTTYWCNGFQMPDIGKHYMIKSEPVITPGNELHVHHIVVYRCKGIDPAVSDGARGNCYGHRLQNLPNCSNIVLAWAIGGQPFYFPESVGFSVGAPGDATFYIMETHYDNPTMKAGMIDNSGIRLTLTQTLRPKEAGLLQLGVAVNAHQVIPPYMDAFVSKGYCSADCLRSGMSAGNVQEIKVFSALQHSHLLGVAMTTRHFRNGTELEPLITDPNYDFDFQENRVLPKERVVLPGDSFRVDCTYDSKTRSNVTFGGPSTQEEMCLTFAFYYPRIPAVNCLSQLVFDSFGIQPSEFHQYLVNNDWTNKTFVADFEAKLKLSKITHACHGDTDFNLHITGRTSWRRVTRSRMFPNRRSVPKTRRRIYPNIKTELYIT